MPKRTNLTANNLKQRPGWFPPIPDTENRAADYHGTPEIYKNPKNHEYFHKIMKENLGFDLEADPEDVKKRIVATSKMGKLAIEDYLKRMEEIHLMPDSPEKIEEFHQAAGALEGALYQQLAKGRLVFIPLGETEPRQLRYNPNVGEFQISGQLKGMDQYLKLNDAFLPRDKKGNIIYQKKENLLEPKHPGEFKFREPQKPKPLKPFNEYLRDMPVMEELKPLREEPKAPKDPQEGGRSKQELIDEEFKRISADVVKPEYKGVDVPLPRFTLKVPDKIEKPNPPRDDLKEPEVPSVENDIKKVEEQLNSAKDPVFPSGFMRVYVSKPVPVEEPFKPVLERPEPPEEPAYIEVPNEPVFKHPLPPVIRFEVPDFYPGKPPAEPAQPVFEVYPDKPVLRPEPAEPERPGFFRRLFSSASVRQYEERHREWENDHNAWIQERDAMPQRNMDYGLRHAEVERHNQKEMERFNEAAEQYLRENATYKEQLAEYEKQVKELEPINEANYIQFEADKEAYEEAKERLGEQYDRDYQEFLTEHKNWEARNKEVIEKNEQIKKEYEETPEYKKYIEDKNWYSANMEPFAFDYKKTPELKKQFTEEYEKNLEKYNAYLEEEKEYQKALEPVKEWIEADDKAKNGDNPDYEENKEARLSERLASNEKANLDYDKELKDYREKMENLFNVRESYVKSPEHIRYVKAKEEYDRNEALKAKKIVKKRVPDQSGINLNLNDEQLDEILASDKQLLPSEKLSEGENNEAVIENNDSDALNYSVVEDILEDALNDENLQAEEKKPELKEDEEEITLYEYELRRYEAYEKDQKYYDLLKTRYDEKKAEYEEKKSQADEWNNSLEQKIAEYDNYINALQITAQNNVNQRIEGYERQKARYDEDHSKWVEEEKDYKQKKDDLETKYVLDNYQWKKEKEEYDKKKEKYDEEVKEYENDVKYYNLDVENYKAEYRDYINKLTQYENDVKMNKIIEARNREYEEEYKKISEAYEKKVMDKNPELKDYKINQLEYVNGTFQWGMMLKDDTTVPEWKKNMTSDKVMDKYFDDHQRKINEFYSYKIKCKNIKEVDPVQKQNYEEMLADKAKYGKYPEHSRPFFKMLDMEEEKLNNVIDKQEDVDFEFFKNAATVKMYNKIVRNELERTYRDVDFNPRNIIKFMDKTYRHDALVDMRRDEPLVKSMKVLFNEDVKMSKSIKRNVQGSLRRLLKEDDSKLANLYNSRYENTKKKAVDPIKKSVHEPKVAMKK